MSIVPLTQPPVRHGNAGSPAALPERHHSEGPKSHFADSLASARNDRASERSAGRGGGCMSPRTDRTNADAPAAENDESAAAETRTAAQQRAQVQSMMLSGAMKFAVTRGDAQFATMPGALPPTSDMDDPIALPEIVAADASSLTAPESEASPESVATITLPSVSWDLPTPETATALPYETSAPAAADVSAIADNSLCDDASAQADAPAGDTAGTSSVNATTAAALQLVAALPIDIAAPAPEPPSQDAAPDDAAAATTDGRSALRRDMAAASLPATAPSVLVEDHFDAPAAVLESANAAQTTTAVAIATPAPTAAEASPPTTDDATVAARTTRAASAAGGDAKGVQTDIAKLAPAFRERLERVIERMRLEYGHAVRVIETVRSQARQDALYAQGRTAPGPVVTWTRNSKHGKGMAADLIIDEAWQNPEGYAHLADIAKEEGLRTLGTRDAGHVEMSGEAGVSAETLGALLSDLQGDAGDAARQVRADVNTETPAESRASTMARVANVAQVARVATVASVAAVAKVATVARPGDAIPQNAPASDAYSPLAVSGVPATVTSSDTATHIATPISSVNLADRISHLMDLQATQDAKPLSSVLLRMGNTNGIEDQIRVDTRGTSVDARLGLGNAQQAAALSDRIGELRDALERRGLTADSVRVQAAPTIRTIDGAAAVRSIAPTIELAAMRAAADSQAQGNTRDQTARDQAQREAFARDHSRHTPRPSSDDARQRSRREQPEDRR